MNNKNRELVIIGGGMSGIITAIQAAKSGIKDILIIERNQNIGGVFSQFSHYNKDINLMIQNLLQEFSNFSIDVRVGSSVLEINSKKQVFIQNMDGITQINAKVIVVATGFIENTRGYLAIPGPRVSGIFTVEAAQQLLNIHGCLCGKNIVVLGSNDIGLLMSQIMLSKGACIKGIYQYSSNQEQFLSKYLNTSYIPTSFSKKILKIHGNSRLEAVTIIDVDETNQFVFGTEQYIDCDTLLLSTGVVPNTYLLNNLELEINQHSEIPVLNQFLETSINGIFYLNTNYFIHECVDNLFVDTQKINEKITSYLI